MGRSKKDCLRMAASYRIISHKVYQDGKERALEAAQLNRAQNLMMTRVDGCLCRRMDFGDDVVVASDRYHLLCGYLTLSDVSNGRQVT